MTTRCGFCSEAGHVITNCISEVGNRIFLEAQLFMRNQFVYYYLSHHGNNEFYDNINDYANNCSQYLNSLPMKSLRFILIKLGLFCNGIKGRLISRIIHTYFYLRLALREFSHLVRHQDRLHIDEYVKYWWHLSIGVPYNEALLELIEYFEFLEVMEYMNENENENNENNQKFPIKVSMTAIDLTDENEKPETFECAICMEDECSILDKVDMGCKHSFCNQCVSQILLDSQKKGKHPCCALCRADYTTLDVRMCHIMDNIVTQFCIITT